MLRNLSKFWYKFLYRGPRSRRLASHPVFSEFLGKEMIYGTMTPPPEEDQDLPVFYILHGMGDSHLALDRFGVSDMLYDAQKSGRIPRCHLITPRGERGFWVNWYDGTHPYESYVLDEIIPRAENEIFGRTLPRNRRHLLGVSMGGIGALHMGLRHPELFASVTSLSGPVLNREQAINHIRTSKVRWLMDLTRIFGDGTNDEFFEAHNPYMLLTKRVPDIGQRLFVAAGSKEKPFFKQTAEQFHEFLLENGVDHEWELYQGGHGWRFWAPVIERAMVYALGRP